MSTYLLLRSNKQSGPYTQDQIRAIGLKPYDLIWVEGRSAAWRYPGEVEEFKSFAPIVEEQPYDRFYKRSPVKNPQQVESKAQITVNSSFSDQESSSVYTSRPSLTIAAQPKEPLLQVGSLVRDAEVLVAIPEKKSIPFIPAERVQSSIILDEKFSQPLDDIKKKYLEQVLGRKKEPLQFRHLATIAAVLFGLILLFAGGIFIGLSINKRGINSTTKDLAKDEAGAGSQQTDYHPRPIPVSTTFPSSPQDKNVVESDDYSQFLTEIKNSDSKTQEKKKEKSVIEKNPELSRVSKDNSNLDSGSASLPVEQRPTLHRTDAIVAKDGVRNNITEYVFLSSNKYYVGTFGGISDLQITVSNRSLYPIDLVAAEVQYIQANNKVFKTENLYFRNIGPGSSVLQEAPKSSRGVKVQYKITVINSMELGLTYSGL